jgi:RimJ/RimL family protein N-acetyltransferase
VTTASDLTIRPLTDAAELELFNGLDYVLNDEFADDLAQGRRRPSWMWVAQRSGRLLARAAWWTTSGSDEPKLFDIFDVDDTLDAAEATQIGVRLVTTALDAIIPDGTEPPEYLHFAPPDWRDNAASHRAVTVRMAALETLGARPLVERLRLEWRRGTPLPTPQGRLTFGSVTDREELIDLMVPVLDNTLDAHSRADLETMSPREAAAKQFDEEFAGFSSPRDWWRVASLDGEPVGFVIPARNTYNAVIAYIGVLPNFRGHGYVDDVLGEGVRILAAEDVPRIRASTDVPNVPMAKAFHRAGFVTFERTINMTWS